MTTLRSLYRRCRHAARCVLGRDVRFAVQAKVPLARHGSEYGGWWICPVGLGRDSVVYSAGIGTDISFDLSLIDTYGLAVWAFDPTPASIAWVQSQRLPGRYRSFPFAVGGRDGKAAFYPPTNPQHVSHTAVRGSVAGGPPIEVDMRRLSTIARELGHRRIDVLKMDIEGAEHDVVQDLIATGLDVGQLLVEFHHRFESAGVEQTRRTVKALATAGYRIFHVSDTGEEYGFIRREPGSGR